MPPFTISFIFAQKNYTAKIYPYPDKYVNGFPTKFGVTLNYEYFGVIKIENGVWKRGENYAGDNGIAEVIGAVIVAWYE